MESYAYPSYNPYSYRYQAPKGKGGQGAWRPRSSYLSGYSEAVAAAAAAEYFDNYQRAQLKAILSQVNPNLTPRLRKANTKEVGVQVNPRQDASVQCSLGPRPLLCRARGARGGGGGGGEQEQGCPVSGAPRSVRFPRTIAVYSPVASRRLTTFLEEAERREPSAPDAAPTPAVEGDAAAAAARAVWPKAEEASGASSSSSQERKKMSAAGPDGAAASPTKAQAEKEWQGEGGKADAADAATPPPLAREEAEPNKARVRFQVGALDSPAVPRRRR